MRKSVHAVSVRSLGVVLAIVCCSLGFSDPEPRVEPPPPIIVGPSEDAAWEKHLSEIAASIKPNPPFEVPDDPPPHEGAMIDYPLTIEPPDLIQVEVLEALPGRPISGERLVRPDGTVSLDFYGKVYVRGLTPEQAKQKIVLHLRKYLTDEMLQLVNIEEIRTIEEEAPEENKPKPDPDDKPTKDSIKPPDTNDDSFPTSRRVIKPARRRVALRQDENEPEPVGAEAPGEDVVVAVEIRETRVDPQDSLAVFVDLTAYNSKVFFVEGNLGAPGRLPFTGNETVHDAITFAGGLTSTADLANIKLVRPGVGDKPAKTYEINWKAITEKGDKTANFQLFPGDRIFVGRHPTVQATIALDRAVAILNTATNSILTVSYMAKNLRVAMQEDKLTPAEFRARINSWVDLMWPLVQKGESGVLDEKTFREALIKIVEPSDKTEADAAK